jgi:putative ABC transport system ATP-binding protein
MTHTQPDPNPSAVEEGALVEARSLVKTYPTPAGDAFALRSVDLQLGRGEFVALIGNPGSGKSTLVNLLAGIDRPNRGRVTIGGVVVHELSEPELAAWREKNLGVVSPSLPLDPERTVTENILLPMERLGLRTESERLDRANELIELLDLAGEARQKPSEISVEKQRYAAIARALANDPDLIIADEPVEGLDADAADLVLGLFERLVAGGKTILMAAGDSRLARRVGCTILLENGEIVNEYLVRALHPLTPDQLIELKKKYLPLSYAPNTPIVRQGEMGDSFYIIVEGAVHVFLERPGFEPLLVNRLEAGSYFGEMALLRHEVRSATIRVAESGRAALIELDAPAFSELIHESPELLREFEEILERRRIALRLQAVAELEPEVFAELSQDQAIREFQPGEAIIRQGQIGRTFFILIDGAVEVFVEQGDGQDIRVASLSTGQLFGEQALLGARRRNATVRVAGDRPAQVVEFQAMDLRRLVNRSPAFRRSIKDAVDSRTKTMVMKRPDLGEPEPPPED